jgi:hypothetical protein
MRIGGMTALGASLAIALALSLGLWGQWTASAQDTFIVNDDTTPADGGCGAPDFRTEDIEEAIDDDTVADGDTLVICEGTYVGEVIVEKRLSIEGLASADREDVVVVSDGNGFRIQTDNVTIRHLKLEGPGTTRQSQGGIVIGANNGEFSDLEITGFGWVEGTGIAAGIVSQGSGPSPDDTKVGPNNYVHDNHNGVMFWGGSRNSVFNNVIERNESTGISLAFVDETYVQENRLAWNGDQIGVSGGSTAFLWNNYIQAAGSVGVFIGGGSSPGASANTLVQIGGSPEHANNFTNQPTFGFYTEPPLYVSLSCGSENTVDAAFNYWEGIETSEELSAFVFNDEFDDPELGTADCPDDDDGAVVVHPFVATPWAPSPTPTLTPSPTATATATATPTPSATPGATRTVDLTPPGWHSLVWSGADATDAGAALACIAGKYSIAYAWEGPTAGFRRHIDGCPVPGICNMSPLDEYNAVMVNITAADVTCVMPVAP